MNRRPGSRGGLRAATAVITGSVVIAGFGALVMARPWDGGSRGGSANAMPTADAVPWADLTPGPDDVPAPAIYIPPAPPLDPCAADAVDVAAHFDGDVLRVFLRLRAAPTSIAPGASVTFAMRVDPSAKSMRQNWSPDEPLDVEWAIAGVPSASSRIPTR